MGKGGTHEVPAGSAAVLNDSGLRHRAGNKSTRPLAKITREEVKKHNVPFKDAWIIIDKKVYDISHWAQRHPGGARVLNHHAGEDATDEFHAFHPQRAKPFAFMESEDMCIGLLDDAAPANIQGDFRELRVWAEKNGLFQSNKLFYAAHLLHILALYFLGWFVIDRFGVSILSVVVSACIIATGQAQAGWLQHDLGHLSVYKESWVNHLMHKFVICGLKGASAEWWNYRHFQHHAKPNKIRLDPDISMAHVFLVGDVIPLRWAAKKKGVMPYNWQHRYWFMIGPPLLLPTVFHIENIVYIIRKRWIHDALWIFGVFFNVWFRVFTPYMGAWGAFWFYMFMRMIESHWFTWVTQMNHIPMHVDYDHKDEDWVSKQLHATCNVTPGMFNDWFTGHLNYQIEHHLFPMMPRHNYYKIRPKVKELCDKHNLDYVEKPLYTAFADIVGSLKSSGEMWYDAYYHN